MESKIFSGSNTWTNEAEVADVLFTRVGNLFGQGYAAPSFLQLDRFP